MNEPVPLADLQDAILDPGTVTALFADLAGCTEVLGVLIKNGPTAPAPDGIIDLARGRDLLDAGSVRGIQIRYRYQGQEWWDTLMRTPLGIRLVRICHGNGQ